MRMPFEKLMEHVAALGEEADTATMRDLSARWGEPAARIADAVDAVRVAAGQQAYATAPDPGDPRHPGLTGIRARETP